jgi:ankyrin repeat protein
MTKDSAFTIDVEYLQQFLEELQKDFAGRNLSSLNAEQAKIVASMPKRIAEYLKIITQIKKEKAEEKEIKNPQQKLEKAKKIEEKLAKLSKEIFITACASTKPIKEVLEFHEKCNLGVKGLNEFGESGLNPLTAAMAGGRSFDDLGQILDKGADINFKSPLGNNAAHFAVMLGLDTRMMEFLIKRGVDINAKNFIGLTPRDMAKMNKNEALDKFLETKGGELNVLAAAKEESAKKERPHQKEKWQNPKNDDDLGVQKSIAKEKELKIQQEAHQSKIRKALELVQVKIALELAQVRTEADLARKKAKAMAEQEAEALRQAEELASKQAQEAESLRQAQELASKQAQEEQFQAISVNQALEVAKQEQEQQLKIQQTQPHREQQLEEDLKEKGSKQKTLEQQALEKILGVNLDEVNIDALLFRAVQGGQSLVAKYLIMSGANVNYSEGNCTVFEMAARSGNNDLVGFVADRVNPETLKLVLTFSTEVTQAVKDIVEKTLHKPVGGKDQQAASVAEVKDRVADLKEDLSSSAPVLAANPALENTANKLQAEDKKADPKHDELKGSLERDVVVGAVSAAKEVAALIGGIAGVVSGAILAPESTKESPTSPTSGVEILVGNLKQDVVADVVSVVKGATALIGAISDAISTSAKESQTSPASRAEVSFDNKGSSVGGSRSVDATRPNPLCSPLGIINLVAATRVFQGQSQADNRVR